MRPPSIPFEALGLNAREHLRVTALAVHLATQQRMENLMRMSDPRDPTQVPPGDLSDATKEGNPLPSDFNDDSDDDDMDEDDLDSSDFD